MTSSVRQYLHGQARELVLRERELRRQRKEAILAHIRRMEHLNKLEEGLSKQRVLLARALADTSTTPRKDKVRVAAQHPSEIGYRPAHAKTTRPGAPRRLRALAR